MTMAQHPPMIRASALAGLDAALAKRGIDLATLLDRSGVGRGPWAPDESFDLNAYARMLVLASDEAGDPCLAFDLAQTFPTGGTGILGYLILNAPTVRESVDCLLRYLCLQVDAVEATYEEGGGIGWLTWRYAEAFVAPRRVFTEFALGLLVLRMRALVGADWTPISVEFEHRLPPCQQAYEGLFGSRLEFDRPVNRLSFSAATLRQRIPEADQRLYEILRKSADREIVELDKTETDDLVSQVRRTIRRNLELGKADLESTAAALQLQPRRLQWRLSQNNTSFEAELNGVRHRLAVHYLRETDVSVTDIAFLLAFSEISAFTRAAHRWFAMSPTAYRLKLREPQAG